MAKEAIHFYKGRDVSEKIEMVRQTDNVYRLDHAVTATQKKSCMHLE